MTDSDRDLAAKILNETEDMKGALFSDKVTKAVELIHAHFAQAPTAEKPSRDGGKFMLRLGVDLRDQIWSAAMSNGRSMNSEIIARITAPQLAGQRERIATAALQGLLSRYGAAPDLGTTEMNAHADDMAWTAVLMADNLIEVLAFTSGEPEESINV